MRNVGIFRNLFLVFLLSCFAGLAGISKSLGEDNVSVSEVLTCTTVMKNKGFNVAASHKLCGPAILQCVKQMDLPDLFYQMTQECKDLLSPVPPLDGVPRSLAQKIEEVVWGIETGEDDSVEHSKSVLSSNSLVGTFWVPSWENFEGTRGNTFQFLDAKYVKVISGNKDGKGRCADEFCPDIGERGRARVAEYEITGNTFIISGGFGTKFSCDILFENSLMKLSNCSGLKWVGVYKGKR